MAKWTLSFGIVYTLILHIFSFSRDVFISLRPSDLIVLGFEPGVGPGTVPPQPCFFSACSLQYGYGSTPMIPIFDDFLG